MATLKVTATGVPIIVGVSQAIRDVLQLVDQVAATDCCVLIEGESGTGKELIARRLFAKSLRAERPFIPVIARASARVYSRASFSATSAGRSPAPSRRCSASSARPREAQSSSTKSASFPLSLQPKLLRVLQEREVMPVGKPVPVKFDARFLAGSNQNLAEMVRLGTFRRDFTIA